MNPGPWLRMAGRQQTLWVFLGLLLFGLASAGDIPWSDDARFYVPAAKQHGLWLARIARFDTAALNSQAIEHHFRSNAEHPPVAKFAMGLGWLVLHHALGICEEIQACRAPVVLLWALMATGLFWLLRRFVSAASGLFATLALMLMPRLLYHGHVETLDVPVAAFTLLAAACLFGCLEKPSRRSGIATVVLFALALGTKLNAPFLLLAVVLYLVVRQPLRFHHDPAGERTVRLPPVPLVVILMALVSPLLTWALWPWLWFDTLARLNNYFLFHLQHYGIYFYFAGRLYGETVAPWYAPLVMTGMTIPGPVLFLALLGSGRPLVAAAGQSSWLRHFWPRFKESLASDPTARLGLFALCNLAVHWAAVSLPGVPKYGGTKLFLPALPWLALLAGLGFEACARTIRRQLNNRRGQHLLVLATGSVLLLPGVLGVLFYESSWLSYYNGLAGGLRGATRAGYERQYYDLAYPEIARALTKLLPEGGAVAIAPNAKEYTPYVTRWQRLGLLSRRIRLARPEQADLLLLTHERRWSSYPDLMATHRHRRLVYRFSRAGVPLFSIFDLDERATRP